MQRQSLGSPSSKQHANGGSVTALKKEDSHIIASSAVEIQNHLKHKLQDNEDEGKTKMKSHITNTEKLVVHLIPLLILLCIVILFLFSHYPFQKGEFEEELPGILDVKKREQILRVMKVGESDILGIQSMRNLQVQGDKKLNLHRKIGDFKVPD